MLTFRHRPLEHVLPGRMPARATASGFAVADDDPGQRRDTDAPNDPSTAVRIRNTMKKTRAQTTTARMANTIPTDPDGLIMNSWTTPVMQS